MGVDFLFTVDGILKHRNGQFFSLFFSNLLEFDFYNQQS